MPDPVPPEVPATTFTVTTLGLIAAAAPATPSAGAFVTGFAPCAGLDVVRSWLVTAYVMRAAATAATATQATIAMEIPRQVGTRDGGAVSECQPTAARGVTGPGWP
jgi:hypothetical protein